MHHDVIGQDVYKIPCGTFKTSAFQHQFHAYYLWESQLVGERFKTYKAMKAYTQSLDCGDHVKKRKVEQYAM